MKKFIENISGLCFGLGVGVGIIAHYTEIGIVCFIVAGIGWLVSGSMTGKKDCEE